MSDSDYSSQRPLKEWIDFRVESEIDHEKSDQFQQNCGRRLVITATGAVTPLQNLNGHPTNFLLIPALDWGKKDSAAPWRKNY